jgi:hypothetical protein
MSGVDGYNPHRIRTGDGKMNMNINEIVSVIKIKNTIISYKVDRFNNEGQLRPWKTFFYYPELLLDDPDFTKKYVITEVIQPDKTIEKLISVIEHQHQALEFYTYELQNGYVATKAITSSLEALKKLSEL